MATTPALATARVIMPAAIGAARRVGATRRMRRRRAHAARHVGRATFGTFGLFGTANERFEIGATLRAFILINRHINPILSRQ